MPFLFEQPDRSGFDALAFAGRDARQHQAFLEALRKAGGQEGSFSFGSATRRASRRVLWRALTGAMRRWASHAAQALVGAVAPLRTQLQLRLQPLAQALQCALGWVPWRRVGQGAALATASSLAIAAYGYATCSPERVLATLARREGALLLDQRGVVMGALFTPVADAQDQAVDHVRLGYTHATKPAPETFVRLVLAAEHPHHFSPWRNLCGVDVPAKVAALFGGASRGGGSTLAEQIGKYVLDEPLATHNWLLPYVQKLQRLGVACSVHQALGGAQGVLDSYLDTVPYSQIGGSTRGAEPSAQVLFGRGLDELSLAQYAVLAAAPQRSIAQVGPGAFSLGCEALRAISNKAAEQLDRDTQVARGQCRTLARARVMVQRVQAPGPALDAALAEIAGYERTGIQPQDVFAALPSKRLVNLSVRSQTLMGPTLVQHIAQATDDLDTPRGQPVALSFDGRQQLGFSQDLLQAMKTVDTSNAARQQMCVTLLPTSGPRHCPGTPPGFGQAQVLLARARIADGGLTRVHLPTAGALDETQQMGSLAKLVITVAAVARGYTADTPVCPRAASDRGRRLRRDHRTAPYGYADCRGHEMPFAQAFANSDSLAFYDVARKLGAAPLLQAAQNLGLDTSGPWREHPAFDLSFGTALATPAEMLALGQAVFAVAYGLPVQQKAPQLLMPQHDATANASAPAGAAPAHRWLAGLLPSAAQRQHLRRLVQAPVEQPNGTLAGLKGTSAVAGKSGTTSSPHRAASGVRPYVQAKYSLTYHPVDQTVALTMIAGPAPLPLSVPTMPVAVLDPVRVALLK